MIFRLCFQFAYGATCTQFVPNVNYRIAILSYLDKKKVGALNPLAEAPSPANDVNVFHI